jgi:hypothetical protein
MRIAGETIETAAIFHDGKVWTLPRPARHIDVMQHIWKELHYKTDDDKLIVIGFETQGFVTSAGRFVRREPAARIAKQAKQIIALKWPPKLYSEDLW